MGELSDIPEVARVACGGSLNVNTVNNDPDSWLTRED